MKFWKYSRVALALIGSVALGLSITCCGVYTSGYMYVTGVQYSQIGAYKIDHDFGYLTPVTGSPFASAGANPVQEVVIPGGRFLAVVYKGASQTPGSGGVSIYTIGGAGVLDFQENYSSSGINPVSIALAPSGTYLYVLDQLAPDGSGKGDITVFQFATDTGKLTLITNANTFNTNGSQLPYFEVDYNPVQIVTLGQYIYALDQAYNPTSSKTAGNIPPACANAPVGSPCATPDVFLYAIANSTGQLTLTQNQPLVLGGVLPGAASTMAVSGTQKYVYIADTALGANPGRILPFQQGAGGVLETLVGGPTNNIQNGAFPDAILANSNGTFLYVANFGPSVITQPNSIITAYTIDPTNGQLQTLSTGFYPVGGAGPIWMVEDPTDQYLYSVNYNTNNISGKIIDQTTGQLSNMFKGTTFATVGQPTFVAVTSRVY